jgi:hypothetical protein
MYISKDVGGEPRGTLRYNGHYTSMAIHLRPDLSCPGASKGDSWALVAVRISPVLWGKSSVLLKGLIKYVYSRAVDYLSGWLPLN